MPLKVIFEGTALIGYYPGCSRPVLERTPTAWGTARIMKAWGREGFPAEGGYGVGLEVETVEHSAMVILAWNANVGKSVCVDAD